MVKTQSNCYFDKPCNLPFYALKMTVGQSLFEMLICPIYLPKLDLRAKNLLKKFQFF